MRGSKIMAVLVAALLSGGAAYAGSAEADSDERIREQIVSRIESQPLLEQSTVHVGVNDGDVYLSGYVGGSLAQEKAEAIAERTKGVESVHSQLHYKQQ